MAREILQKEDKDGIKYKNIILLNVTIQILNKHICNCLGIFHRVHFCVSNKLSTYSPQFRHIYSSVENDVEQKLSRKTYKAAKIIPRRGRWGESMREGSL